MMSVLSRVRHDTRHDTLHSTGAPEAPGRGARQRIDWTCAIPGMVTLAVMLTGLGGASYWGDEAATVTAASRPLPSLLRTLTHVDAVHGSYYLLAWIQGHLFGDGPIALRLPSAIAAAAGAAAVAAIGRRMRSPRAGLLAGLMFAGLPAVSLWGQNARSYAMVMACAALASLALLRFLDRPDTARLTGYAGAIAALGYLNMFALLLVPAHAVTTWFGYPDRRWLFKWWAAGAAVGSVAVTPVAVLGYGQRGQVAWLPGPGIGDLQDLMTTLLGGSVISAVLIALLAGAALHRVDARPGSGPATARTGWLCLPWMVLPPASLFAASLLIHVYSIHYVLFCLPAIAVLAGVGLAALPPTGQAAMAALLLAATLPVQWAIRQPDGHGDNIRGAAHLLAADARTSDALIFWRGNWDPATGIPDWAYAYPYGFSKPRDIAQAATPAQTDSLFGRDVSYRVLRRRLTAYQRVWVAEHRYIPVPHWLTPGLHLDRTWQFGSVVLRLYTRWPVTRHTTTRHAIIEDHQQHRRSLESHVLQRETTALPGSDAITVTRVAPTGPISQLFPHVESCTRLPTLCMVMGGNYHYSFNGRSA
jgi:mannosyltransferase